eukprot:3880641-Rhodomonas_salina.2
MNPPRWGTFEPRDHHVASSESRDHRFESRDHHGASSGFKCSSFSLVLSRVIIISTTPTTH